MIAIAFHFKENSGHFAAPPLESSLLPDRQTDRQRQTDTDRHRETQRESVTEVLVTQVCNGKTFLDKRQYQ